MFNTGDFLYVVFFFEFPTGKVPPEPAGSLMRIPPMSAMLTATVPSEPVP